MSSIYSDGRVALPCWPFGSVDESLLQEWFVTGPYIIIDFSNQSFQVELPASLKQREACCIVFSYNLRNGNGRPELAVAQLRHERCVLCLI